MLKYGLPTVAMFSILLLATLPSRPAIGFCLLVWMMFGFVWGFWHVMSTSKRNDNSTYDIPPSGGF